MQFFYKFFGRDNHINDHGEMFVCCPFPHYDAEGNAYFEKNPSAHINIEKSVFHCKVCNIGLSEAQFLARIHGISYKDALMLLHEMEEKEGQGDSWVEFENNFWASEGAQELARELGILDVAKELRLGYEGEGISFPVFVYGELLDVRNYKPGRTAPDGRSMKVISRKGAKALILPYDLWIEDERPTLLCAGEKDMAIARAHGFNAITFTGGERSFPKLFQSSFQGKRVYIAYDNDAAGIQGAKEVASKLKDAGAIPYVVTGHHQVCVEEGEDIHDFFMKYGKTADDLQKILDETPEFTQEEYLEIREQYIPSISVADAGKGQYYNRFVSSRVTVISIFEEVFQAPEYVVYEKDPDYVSDKDTMMPGEKRVWSLEDENLRDVLLLIDSGLKEQQVYKNLRKLAGVPEREPGVKQHIQSRVDVYKAVVSDDFESFVADDEESGRLTEFLVYVIGERLEPGKKYRIIYKPVPHPLRGQQVVGIVTRLEESDDSVSRFKLTERVRESLRCFQVQEGETVADKMQELFERAKGFVGVEARKELVYATDLFYHTPLEFQFANRTERAYLDIMIIGDTRTGKSQTAKKMREMYELGTIVSLKTTTYGGLVGGSDASGGGWKTKIGILPRSHKGALILEEFSDSGKNLIKGLTEVRSSNRVRIGRVNGTIDVPAMVRMLTISNTRKNSDGETIPLRQYSNGVRVIMDLVGAAEDIARYDFFVLVPKPEGYISPLEMFPLEPFPKEAYMNRIRWVWSRTKDQVVLNREVLEHIVRISEDLNRMFDSHINIFGAETWKKLSRVSIAVAGLLCSMDETGEKLVVTKEHVDWAKDFLVKLYDNDLFKLREYVEDQRRLTECTETDVFNLQGLYNNHTVMLQQLEMATEMGQRQLQAVSGLDSKDFAQVINQMARYNFIRWQGEKIVPTEKFRKAMRLVSKNTYMKKVGETL